MINFEKKVNLLANIAIISVAILLGVVLVKNFLLPSRSDSKPQKATIGMKAPLHGIEWAKNKHTLLLVLRKDCRFCTVSAEFYKRLAQEVSNSDEVRLVAVFPNEIDEGKKYLDDLGINISDIRKAELQSLGVMGTPTLLMVNRLGMISALWVGKLTPEQELDVLNKLEITPQGNK